MITNNQISLATAEKMTKLYREKYDAILAPEYRNQNILVRSETFTREGFEKLISQPDCTGVRIYYGMTDDLKIHAIAVGVNHLNEDILHTTTHRIQAEAGEEDAILLEEATRCPDDCPPPSPLNP